MLTFRSRSDSGSRWDMHIHTRIPILMDSMDRPCTQGRHSIGPVGTALSSHDVFTGFTMVIIIIIDDEVA